jgi:hypothetical protein
MREGTLVFSGRKESTACIRWPEADFAARKGCGFSSSPVHTDLNRRWVYDSDHAKEISGRLL